MKKLFIFILLIIQSSCASLYFTEEYYFAMNDYKAWAVTIDGKDGMVSTRSYESQSFINARVIYQCEKDYGKKCLLFYEGNNKVWDINLANYNKSISNENNNVQQEVEISSPPSYSCSRGKCTAN